MLWANFIIRVNCGSYLSVETGKSMICREYNIENLSFIGLSNKDYSNMTYRLTTSRPRTEAIMFFSRGATQDLLEIAAYYSGQINYGEVMGC